MISDSVNLGLFDHLNHDHIKLPRFHWVTKLLSFLYSQTGKELVYLGQCDHINRMITLTMNGFSLLQEKMATKIILTCRPRRKSSTVRRLLRCPKNSGSSRMWRHLSSRRILFRLKKLFHHHLRRCWSSKRAMSKQGSPLPTQLTISIYPQTQ